MVVVEKMKLPLIGSLPKGGGRAVKREYQYRF